MKSYSTTFGLLSAMAELCLIFPIYCLAAIPLKYPLALSPWIAVLFTVASFFINISLAKSRRRLITMIIINLFFFFGGLFILLKQAFFPGYSLWPPTWLGFLFAGEAGAGILAWYWTLILSVTWIWVRSALLTRKPLSYSAAILRFEVSMGVMFATFLIAALASIPLPGACVWATACLLINAGAISLAKNQAPSKNSFFWFGPAFLALFTIPAAIIISLFFSPLSESGGFIYQATLPLVQFIGKILLNVLVWVIKFFNVAPIQSTPENSVHSVITSNLNGSGGTQSDIMSWVIIIILLIILIPVALYAIYTLFKYLWRTRVSILPESSEIKKSWWQQVLSFLAQLGKKSYLLLLPYLARQMETGTAYRFLLKWGDYRHCSRKKHETPYEYSTRLAERFPQCRNHFALIAKCYVLQKYGNRPIDKTTMKELRLAVRRLYSPWALLKI
ncbi:MAG: DUF4129 domain-containing protein [Desulfitobacteriaceae bacterium]|nr:DUF4129 domain-containing protein [Desulfitobacteriaceae bacterium]MDD4753672.1 DUF4129 domain-containing protein [Desulfitobacteriaceae bacterium]